MAVVSWEIFHNAFSCEGVMMVNRLQHVKYMHWKIISEKHVAFFIAFMSWLRKNTIWKSLTIQGSYNYLLRFIEFPFHLLGVLTCASTTYTHSLLQEGNSFCFMELFHIALKQISNLCLVGIHKFIIVLFKIFIPFLYLCICFSYSTNSKQKSTKAWFYFYF